MSGRPRVCRHDHRAVGGARKSRDRALYFAGVAKIDRGHLHSDRRRHRLDDRELADPSGYGEIPKDRRSGHARCDLFKELHPFHAQTIFELHKAGRIAARPRQTIDDAGADGIEGYNEDNWQGASNLEQPLRRVTGRQDDIRGESGQFHRVFPRVLGIAAAPPRLD